MALPPGCGRKRVGSWVVWEVVVDSLGKHFLLVGRRGGGAGHCHEG